MDYTPHFFEYKCRRCGFINQGDMENNGKNMELFLKLIEEKIKRPPLTGCQQCGIRTVQDVVSYSAPKFVDYIT